jgi:uncharacterized membrane protein
MPPNGAHASAATAITEDGVALGVVYLDRWHGVAARWDAAGRLTMLERPPGGAPTFAASMARDGTITGYAVLGMLWDQPLRWDRHGRLIQIGPEGFSIRDVNNRGVAVGSYRGSPYYGAVLWDRSGQTHWLAQLCDDTFAGMVNDSGIIAGVCNVDGRTRPIRWDRAGRPAALPLLPGFTSGVPADINQRGVIAGIQSDSPAGGERVEAAVRWDQSGQPTVLPTPPTTTYPTVAAINDHGDVIGTIRTAEGQHRAVLWLSSGVPRG